MRAETLKQNIIPFVENQSVNICISSYLKKEENVFSINTKAFTDVFLITLTSMKGKMSFHCLNRELSAILAI